MEPQTQKILDGCELNVDNLNDFSNANELISNASQPVIVIGLEARSVENTEKIRQLIDRSDYPVLTTYKAKGVIFRSSSTICRNIYRRNGRVSLHIEGRLNNYDWRGSC